MKLRQWRLIEELACFGLPIASLATLIPPEATSERLSIENPAGPVQEPQFRASTRRAAPASLTFTVRRMEPGQMTTVTRAPTAKPASSSHNPRSRNNGVVVLCEVDSVE
jgi:hypothetical protein